jgi:uncharacterized protein (DUF433 family)
MSTRKIVVLTTSAKDRPAAPSRDGASACVRVGVWWRFSHGDRDQARNHRDPGLQSGAPVFMGTRIAVKILVDYLADGQPIEDFVKHYPSASREQAVAAMDEVEALLEKSL